MSLFSAINQSAAALQASQLGLQVVGHNIANANTPGYIRQELELVPASSTRVGQVIVGQGVLPKGTHQVIDQALAERMWSASTAVAGGETLQSAYRELEDIVGGLDDTGLGYQLTNFNEALHNLSNSPADPAARDLVLLQASALTSAINQAYTDTQAAQVRANAQIPALAGNLNSITSRIADLNLEIMVLEGGRSLSSDATGLRDERYQLLGELAQIVDINVQEQANGSVSVFVGGDYLLADANYREVYTAFDETTGGQEIRIKETDSPLQAKGGTIGAAQTARDEVFGAYLNDLDTFAGALARTVNEVHSQGQGLQGNQQMTGTVSVETGVPLERAELDFVPNNGSFDIQVVDDQGQLVSSHRIEVQNLGIVGDSTVNSIVEQMNAIDGLAARINGDGQIELEAESAGVGFTFADDNSGFLAAAGLNTMFTGTGASDLAVNDYLLQNPNLISVSKGGVGNDTEALSELVDLIAQPSDALNGQSLQAWQQQKVGAIAQSVSLQRASTEGNADFYATLEAQHLSIVGVNLDEEAIKLIGYQRAFQASSRVIATASEMLDLLVSL
ncbi:flagellar hook-associated protein FlgK [Roseimaritima ulvae]|uniref:Flagellar hook-associated protein 1 n=1 Tax=Roseimaritima ulvae TaxID=980254 RepID=A0A5B9R6Q9_9BACT|nr:flagellar hook-associated protein FlgK [Roseimaritima ulvae]QEG42281.1 Flagellar hook-associated protein 1 [Roseimaritima ulvae]